ncbi:MAG: DUF3122 domain-containing protein [Synechococcales cyanobacterium C42_A2020_086]|nr:DUF3122 domain-containing protein [Synechococcales cyanobacterium C42_A2020_086]
MRRSVWRLLVGWVIAILMSGLILGPGNGLTRPAWAAVTQIKESVGQVLCRSQHSLPDAAGHTWQVILFKQSPCAPGVAAEPSLLYLRLAGLPGAAEVAHPAPLILTTSTGQVFNAPDVFWEDAPASTIGQYDLKAFAADLPAEPLRLTIPLIDQETVELTIPRPVVQEWQTVIRQQAS